MVVLTLDERAPPVPSLAASRSLPSLAARTPSRSRSSLSTPAGQLLSEQLLVHLHRAEQPQQQHVPVRRTGLEPRTSRVHARPQPTRHSAPMHPDRSATDACGPRLALLLTRAALALHCCSRVRPSPCTATHACGPRLALPLTRAALVLHCCSRVRPSSCTGGHQPAGTPSARLGRRGQADAEQHSAADHRGRPGAGAAGQVSGQGRDARRLKGQRAAPEDPDPHPHP
eukprot:scaffold109374_cov63-Phaeocystis_antarctica.AAC.1